MKTNFAAGMIALLAMPAVAWGHGESQQKPSARKHARALEETAFGRAGDPGRVTRTIKVEMSDKMHFLPEDIQVNQGETVMFVVTNKGKLMHEMVLGTFKELAEHAELMRKFPGMEHDEPYMAHAAPGKTATIVWQFTKAGDFQFACLVPGHMDAGMKGRVIVFPAARQPKPSVN